MSITRVWFDPGCIRCSACAYSAPQVFRLPANADAVIDDSARADGVDPTQVPERVRLNPECARRHHACIREAVEGCPVGIIHLEEVSS